MSDAPDPGPSGRAADPWEQVIEDTEATAADYRASGWTAIDCHPGAVRTLLDVEDDERQPGLEVRVPDDDYRAVRDALADRAIENVDVYRADGDERVYVLLALECESDTAVLIPAYYELAERDALERLATDRGLSVTVRPFEADEVVTVALEEPSLLFAD